MKTEKTETLRAVRKDLYKEKEFLISEIYKKLDTILDPTLSKYAKRSHLKEFKSMCYEVLHISVTIETISDELYNRELDLWSLPTRLAVLSLIK